MIIFIIISALPNRGYREFVFLSLFCNQFGAQLCQILDFIVDINADVYVDIHENVTFYQTVAGP